jgi:hypothetical protein
MIGEVQICGLPATEIVYLINLFRQRYGTNVLPSQVKDLAGDLPYKFEYIDLCPPVPPRDEWPKRLRTETVQKPEGENPRGPRYL